MECVRAVIRNGVRNIRFENLKKKNAISPDGYRYIGSILDEDAQNDDVKLTVITGTGDYFTSGNDLSWSLERMSSQDPAVLMRESWFSFRLMLESFLNYPKLLILVINGPAVGIGVTICGLCDVVYASDTATFSTPFVKLGLTIEGCGSYLLPRIMGKSKASELLLLGETLTVQEALNFNLVSKIIPKAGIDQFIEQLDRHTEIPLKSLITNKKLMMNGTEQLLKFTAIKECEALWLAQNSEEFYSNILTFMSRKQNKL